MTKNADELDDFYDDTSRRNLLLQMKNPLAWYYTARRSMLLANMIRMRIEKDIPVDDPEKIQSVPLIFKPSRSADIYWLQSLRAAIRNDVIDDHFVGDGVNVETEETIDKSGIDMISMHVYRKLHSLYPTYLYFIGAAMENVLKAIYAMQNTDSIHSENDPDIVNEITGWDHKLYHLAADGLRLPMTKKERGLLRTLQEFVVWAGKYPGPKTPERYADFVRGKDHPNPFSVAEHANFSQDEIAIHDLYERLLEILNKEAEKRLTKLDYWTNHV
ncbi:MAG: hypothetical protein ACXV5H_08625 [Halobacteriota archaeon]